MVAQIDIILRGWTRAENMLRVVDRDMFKGPKTMRRRLLNDIARAGVKASRENIRTQGHGTWPPLSKWTRAQTGRRKALLAQIPRITAILANRAALTAAVIFRSPGDWTLTQHHRGFTERATNKVVKIPLKNPGLIGERGITEKYFIDSKDTVVPRRPIWPEGAQLRRLMATAINRWRVAMDARLKKVR